MKQAVGLMLNGFSVLLLWALGFRLRVSGQVGKGCGAAVHGWVLGQGTGISSHTLGKLPSEPSTTTLSPKRSTRNYKPSTIDPEP